MIRTIRTKEMADVNAQTDAGALGTAVGAAIASAPAKESVAPPVFFDLANENTGIFNKHHAIEKAQDGTNQDTVERLPLSLPDAALAWYTKLIPSAQKVDCSTWEEMQEALLRALRRLGYLEYQLRNVK